MTDRYHSLTVVLEEGIRTDDAEPLIEAIQQLRGVLRVDPRVASVEQWTADARARHELGRKLWEVLYPERAPE